MGLIDLKTDLKSLRYGKDTIGGGYSGQPYIQTPIPDSFNDLGANEDFILRGGVNAIGDAATDVRRLTKMFFDLKSPNGLLFIAKQNLLSQIAVRTQTSDTVNEGIYTPLNTLAQAGVVELGGHLNKQGENPFVETGAYANSEILYSVKVKPTQPIENNRLTRLYEAVQINVGTKLDGFILNNGPSNVLTYDGGPNSILGAGQTNIRYSTFRTGKQNPLYTSNPAFFTGKNNQKTVNFEDKQVGGLNIALSKPWIKSDKYLLPDFTPNTPQSSSFYQINNQYYNYNSSLAKPNTTDLSISTYLLGSRSSVNYNVKTSKGVTNFINISSTTFVNPSVYQSGSTYPQKQNPLKTGGNNVGTQNGTITYTPDLLQKANPSKNSPSIKEDFRKVLRNNLSNNVGSEYEKTGNIVSKTYISYPGQNVGVKNLIGNPGQNRVNKNYSNFSKGLGTALDKINASNIGNGAISNKDLVQFRITGLFTGGQSLSFRAFLGAMSDSYTAGVNAQQYTGRGENFYTYSGQTRKISLSWTIAALSREELLPMYKRLNYLASMTAPKYVNGFMQGPLVNLTVGGYIYNLPGYIEGFSLEIGEESPWEIAIKPDGSKDTNTSQLPHIIKVNGFNFTPIPNYLPEAGNATESRFISLVNTSGKKL